MGKVIAFRPSANRAQRKLISNGGAEILFFLGVRYSRMEDPPNTTSGAPRATGGESVRGKKRKRGA